MSVTKITKEQIEERIGFKIVSFVTNGIAVTDTYTQYNVTVVPVKPLKLILTPSNNFIIQINNDSEENV